MTSTCLIIFDFDHTILDSNSDENVPRHLGRLDLLKERYHQGAQWTSIISECVEPFAEEEVRAAVRATANVHKGTIAALSLISSLPRDKVSICIASDANTLFIEETLRHVAPHVTVDAVHTNAFVSFSEPLPDGKKCRIDKYEPSPHGCELCKHNPQMCKSKIVQQLLDTTRLADPTVVYVGDGDNDYCPVAKVLRPRDVCLYRRGFGLERKRLQRPDAAVACSLIGWSDGDDMNAAFRSLLLEEEGRRVLPRIIRFGEGLDTAFRALTLRERLPQLIQRLLRANEKELTGEAVLRLQQLSEDMRLNRNVQPMPGDPSPPRWLLNYVTSGGEGNEPVLTWSDVPWLQGEIYFNKLVLALSQCVEPGHDVYSYEKEEALVSFLDTLVLPIIEDDPSANPFHWSRPEALPLLLRNMLWGNSVDLSMYNLSQIRDNSTAVASDGSSATTAAAQAHAAALVRKDNLIAGNQLDDITETIQGIIRRAKEEEDQSAAHRSYIDVIMDNAGVECCADLLFALWVVTESARRVAVRFHMKAQPFYVSDTNLHDVEFLLATLERSASPFVSRVRSLVADGLFILTTDPFWTAPCEIREMPPLLATSYFFSRSLTTAAPSHATVRAKSQLVLFKGDLNFRRLVGDRDWDNGISFSVAGAEKEKKGREKPLSTVVDRLEPAIADFWPFAEVPVAALRTAKSEVSVGVPKETVSLLDASEKNWRFTGKYAVALIARGTV